MRRSGWRLIPGFCLAFCAAADLPAQASRGADVVITYTRVISRIFQANCQQCHRAGDIAPFPLDSYDLAVQNASAIQRALVMRTMPPWKPVDGFGEFQDSYQISEGNRKMILLWIANGMPYGDPAELPPPLPPKGDWPLGTPDVSLAMVQPFTPPTDGDTYRCFNVPTGLNDAAYLSAVDILPGARQVVHHVILFQDTTGIGQTLESQDGQPGYPCFGGPGIDFTSLNALNAIVGAWAPGQRTQFLPSGIAVQLQKGANIIMQVHYHPNGGTFQDQTRVGLYFSKVPVTQRLFEVPLVNTSFTIPAGASNYVVSSNFTIPTLLDAHAIEVYPHMHLLGRDIKVDLVNLDGSITPVVWENDWNFNYQGAYTFKAPLAAPAGTTARLTCTFDNSTANVNNPNNPPIPVSWGERTVDEMCLAFVGVTFDYEKLLPFGAPLRGLP